MTSLSARVLVSLLLVVGVDAYAQCPGPPILCDEPVTAGIDVVGEADYLSFDVTDGEIVEIIITRVSGANFSVRWRIVDANCDPVPQPCGAFQVSARLDCADLSPANNPHSIQIVDAGNDATGTYTVELQRLTASTACDNTPLICDEAVVRTLASRVGSDLYSFDVTGTEEIEIMVADVGGAGFDPRWRVLDGAGLPVPGPCGAFNVPTRQTCTLVEAGNPHRIEIVDAGQDGAGTYALHFQRLVAAVACDDVPIECDVAVTDSITSRVESDLFSFDVTGTEEIEIMVADVGGALFDPRWRVIDGAGLPVPGACGSYAAPTRATCSLPEAGNPYRIEIVDAGRDGVGTYALHFQRLVAAVACDDVPIECGVAVVDSITSRVESDLFSFEVTGTEEIEITVADVGGALFDPWWRVIDGAGLPVPGACGTYAAPMRTICTLPESGNPYRIEIVDLGRNGIGVYALHFQRLVAAVACDDVPIECDVAVTDSITSRVESDLFRFDVTGTEEIEITVADVGGTLFDPWWRVIDGTGLPIPGACGTSAAPARTTCTLPEAGNPYRIEIVDSGRDGTGTYALHIQRLVAALACDDAPIQCDVAVVDSITSRVESDLFSFVVTSTEVVEVAVADVGGTLFDPFWRVLDSMGLPVVGGCGDYTGPSRRTCVLTEAGSPYRIELADSGRNGTGAYALHLQRLSVSGATCDDTPIECDVAVTDSITNRVESNLYSFDVTGTEEIEVAVADVGGAGFDPFWRVVEASGLPVSGGCGDFAGPSRRTCTLLEAGNPYRIEMADAGRDGFGIFTLHMQRLVAAVACDDVAIVCDVARTDSITSRVESDLFSFEVEGSGEVEIRVTDVGGAGFDPWWRVLDGMGLPVEGPCGVYGPPRTQACVFPDSGNPYRLEMAERHRDAIGIYEVLVTGCIIGVGTQPAVPGAFRLAIRGPHPPRNGAGVHFLYDVPPPGADLSIDLYDVTGRLVRRMVQGHVPAGSYSGVIAGPRGTRVGAGVYFLRMETPSYRETKSIVLLR